MSLGCRQTDRAEEGELDRGFQVKPCQPAVSALAMATLVPESRGGLSYPVILGRPRGGGESVTWYRRPQMVLAQGCESQRCKGTQKTSFGWNSAPSSP